MPSHVSSLLVHVLATFGALAVACRSEPDWGDPDVQPVESQPDDATGGTRANGAGGTGATGATDAAGGAVSAGSGAKGGAGTARGGAANASSGGSAGDDGAAGAGNTEPDPDVTCDGQDVSWEELQSGQVRSGAGVAIAATATSQKFLLSHAKTSGSCLWGAFAGAEAVDGKPRGVLLVSYGEPADGELPCLSGTDGLPDALVPGDELRVSGRFSPYAPMACDGVVPAPQLMVDAACPVVVAGKRAPLTPVTLTHEVADALARGEDAALIRRYAAGLVRVEGVSGVRADDGEGVVAPYGVLRFAETQLEVHNDVEYAAVAGGARPLVFPYPSNFTAVTGLVHLDYCTWTLAPRDRCHDFRPAGAGCSR